GEAHLTLEVLGGEGKSPVVVEVGEDFDSPPPPGDPAPPRVELRVRIVAADAVTPVEANERPVGHQLMGLERPAWRVADHERRPVLAQERVDVLAEPALVPELEAVATGRKAVERLRQPLVVAPEVGGQLPEDGAELRRAEERLDPLVETLQPLAQVAEALDMR